MFQRTGQRAHLIVQKRARAGGDDELVTGRFNAQTVQRFDRLFGLTLHRPKCG
jgi:hypothetical protein